MGTRTNTNTFPSGSGPGLALPGELIGITSIEEECFS